MQILSQYLPDSWRKYIPAKFSFFDLFIFSYLLVHVTFEYNFWIAEDRPIFSKYELAEEQGDALAIAKKVYYTKATWMIFLVVLLYLRVSFHTAMIWSFLLYSLELVVLFPPRLYTLLNLGLAALCLLELWHRHHRGGGKQPLQSSASPA